ncbi:hypothetical protein L6452_04864 [Arctium lappa]|uniref:Uncharacterized protein n=1 Tax=Arctium lappa TaxID=4217 RepID=A0ACB9EEE1_ARCLA|nr:hypothetical protein L6452_04864 [Arctium lappa]
MDYGGATTANKKKVRPSLLDLHKCALEKRQLQNQQKSTRRNPNSTAAASADDYSANEDERTEKKVKLVVRLPQLQQQHASSDLIRSSSVNSASCGSDSNANVDNRKINSGSGHIIADNQGHQWSLDPQHLCQTRRRTLVGCSLSRLSCFLSDYHEIFEHPMDFGTVKSKLDEGLYSRLDELEVGYFLLLALQLFDMCQFIYSAQYNVVVKCKCWKSDIAKPKFDPRTSKWEPAGD